MDKTTSKLEFKNDGNGKKYEVEVICNSVVYVKELDSSHYLPGLYYLISWKSYPEEENTWEPTSAVLHLCKLISTFHHDHPEKPTAISPPIDSALSIARPTAKSRAEASSTKQKQGRLAKDSSASKCAKKTWTSNFLSRFWPCLDSRQKIPTITWSRSTLLRPVVWFFDFFHFLIFTQSFRFFLLSIGQ